MAFTEDMSLYLRTEDFGTSAVYSGSGATIKGIFDAQYEEAFALERGASSSYGDLYGRVQASSPVFTCATADVASAGHGQTITIGATVYKITGVEPDGTGMTVLRLEKQ